jgi:TRAP-type C4-dicarboxylate transport system substrate-binding protein
MKKISSLILCVILVVSMTACGGGPAPASATTPASGSEPGSAAEPAAVEPGSKGSFNFIIGAGHSAAGFSYVSCCSDVFIPKVIEKAAEIGYNVSFTEGFGGTIAPLADVFEATETGLMDFGLLAAVFEPVKAMVINYSNYIPFGVPDIQMVYDLGWMLYESNKEAIDNHFASYNLKYLGITGATASYHIITQFPFDSIEDLKGRKVAAAGANLNLLQNTSGVGVQSNLNEAYTSLQTGVYEAWIIYVPGAAGYNLYEVCDYYTRCDFGATNAGGLIANMDTWNDIPEDLQQVILDAARNDYGPAAVLRSYEEEKAGYKVMEEYGTNISTLSEEERNKWIFAIPDPAKQAIRELEAAGLPGEKIFKEYYEFAEQLGYTASRKFGFDE